MWRKPAHVLPLHQGLVVVTLDGNEALAENLGTGNEVVPVGKDLLALFMQPRGKTVVQLNRRVTVDLRTEERIQGDHRQSVVNVLHSVKEVRVSLLDACNEGVFGLDGIGLKRRNILRLLHRRRTLHFLLPCTERHHATDNWVVHKPLDLLGEIVLLLISASLLLAAANGAGVDTLEDAQPSEVHRVHLQETCRLHAAEVLLLKALLLDAFCP
mmetsp:Transcript_75598/g.87910  ORF Transcript_75598/g.87910 Transcript_75598/m.87910 type:complete len:213 (-) Transcript_75598:64-702(-)